MKKYGGCLSFLLPLWIVGQLISLVTNITVMCHQEEQSYVPMIFIVTNIVAIIGIILLLNYKKWGFYALVFSCILSFSVGVIYPDDVNSGFAFKSFLCLVFFLLLLCFKNKETQKNGYQTLGLFEFATKTNTYCSGEVVDKDNVQSNNDNYATLNDKDGIEVKEEYHNNATQIPTDNQSLHCNFVNNSILTMRRGKIYYICFGLLFLVVCVVLYLNIDRRTNQERFEYAQQLIANQNYEDGIKELKKIEGEYTPAKTLLGKLFCQNDSVERNLEYGKKLLWEAFEQRDSDAFNILWSIFNEDGDWDMLCKIATKATEFGNVSGYEKLAWLYYTDELGGKNNDKTDYKKAEYYALKIAEKNSDASFYLGSMYYSGGYGIEKDKEKAFYWWNNGANLGDAYCYDALALCYFNGYGVNKNFKKAYDSLKKAISIAPTDDYAYYHIALLFKDGLYVEPNRDSLKYYLQKAKDNGNKDALIMYENEF